MGTRLAEIISDRHEDLLYEDSRAVKLTSYVMAERCLQVEAYEIYNGYKEGDYSTLTYILEGGFKGFHNMEPSELIEEYKQIEEQWYELESSCELHWQPYEEDPIWQITERLKENFDRTGRTHG